MVEQHAVWWNSMQYGGTACSRLKSEKRSFLLQEVEYLGHKISAKGLQLTTEKVQAIAQAPQLANVKSFLRMLNYYGKFLPNLLTCLAPLYKLLQKQSHWDSGCE